MELYHGSYTSVDKPRILKGQYTKDFGTGFYCTIMKQQAERWAGKFDSPIAFCTEAALECLTFKTVYTL
jgi:hypothetical protein